MESSTLYRLSSTVGLRIGDDTAVPGREEDEEDVPVVAEFIDERPEGVKLVEEFRTNSKWKLSGDWNEEDSQGSYTWGLARSAMERQRHESPEPSPPGGEHNSSLELSPLRRQRHDTPEPSPPRRRRRPGTPDLPPPRQQRQDLPPRREKPRSASGNKSRRKGRTLLARKAQHRSQSPPERSSPRRDAKGAPKKAHTMPSRAKAGLLSADVRQEEKQQLRRQERSSKQLQEESQSAQTVFRDKAGRKRNLAQEQLEQRLRAEAEAQREERYARWGKGLAQERQQQQQAEDAIREMQKPLARYIHDQDLDRTLRAREREGDPMAALIKKRKAKENKGKEKPRYKGPAPPLNRFNIWPGHRWDGVDRSKGFEQQRSARGASAEAAWGIQDM